MPHRRLLNLKAALLNGRQRHRSEVELSQMEATILSLRIYKEFTSIFIKEAFEL
jgi:hypothetical protein